MDESRKKQLIMYLIVSACLILAVAITFFTRSTHYGIETIGRSEMIWVKCVDPACGAEYETGKRAYYEFVQANSSPMSVSRAPLVCEQCDQNSIYQAVKCEKCETVFFYGAIPDDFKDRCTECGYSKTEDLRQQAKK